VFDQIGSTAFTLYGTTSRVLLAGGVDIRALAEYLGHSDPGFTLRTYTHLMPSSADRMRKAVDRALNGETPDGLPARDVP
jgi:integrase